MLIAVAVPYSAVKYLGSDSDHYEAMMAISLALVDKCDAILMIGSSPGANRERGFGQGKGSAGLRKS
jgi:hypothetical protein